MRKKLIPILISILLLFISQAGGMINWKVQMLSSSISYFLGVFILTHNRKDIFFKTAVIIIPYILIYTYAISTDSRTLFHTLPIPIMTVVGTIFALIISYQKELKSGIKIFLVYLFLLAFCFFLAVDNYINIVNKETNKYSTVNLDSLEFLAESGDTISLTKFKNQILVLDFWSTNCGICYQNFPDFDKRNKKYLSDPRIKFLSIHMPSKRDSLENSLKLLDDYNYSFEQLFSLDIHQAKRIGIHYYPQYMVLDRNHKIQYVGSMNTDENDFIYHFDNLINKELSR